MVAMCDSDTAKNSTNAKVLTLQSDRSRRVINGDSDSHVRFDTGEVIMLFAGIECEMSFAQILIFIGIRGKFVLN